MWSWGIGRTWRFQRHKHQVARPPCSADLSCPVRRCSAPSEHDMSSHLPQSPFSTSAAGARPLCLPTHNPPDPVTLASTGRSQSKAKWDEQPPSSGQDTETETGRNPVWTPRALPHDSNLHFRFYAVNPLPPTVCASADPMNQVQPQF